MINWTNKIIGFKHFRFLKHKLNEWKLFKIFELYITTNNVDIVRRNVDILLLTFFISDLKCSRLVPATCVKTVLMPYINNKEVWTGHQLSSDSHLLSSSVRNMTTDLYHHHLLFQKRTRELISPMQEWIRYFFVKYTRSFH